MLRSRLIGIFGVFILIFGVAMVAAPTALAASVWWVDNSNPTLCSDIGPGTSATPLCTISAAAKKAVNAGDQVMVRPGTYREQVTVAASGTTGSPISFTASAPGVVVLGTRDLSVGSGWTQVGATAVWSQAYAPPSAPSLQLQVFRDGVRLPEAASLAALTAGQFFYDTVAKVLYVDAGGPNPAVGHTIAAFAQAYGFDLVGRSNVVVNGFTVAQQNIAGVRLSGSSAITVQNVTATQSGGNGILAEAASSNVTVTGSTVSGSASIGIKLLATTGSLISADISHDNLSHGISLQTSSNNLVVGHTAYNNANVGPVHIAVGIDVSASSTGVTLEQNTRTPTGTPVSRSTRVRATPSFPATSATTTATMGWTASTPRANRSWETQWSATARSASTSRAPPRWGALARWWATTSAATTQWAARPPWATSGWT